MSVLSQWQSWRLSGRVERARRSLKKGDFNEARLELEGVEHPDAEALRQEARQGLVVENLREWLAQTAAGGRSDAREALQRARSFGATPAQEEDARRAWSGR